MHMHAQWIYIKGSEMFKFSHVLLLHYEPLTGYWNKAIFIMHANPRYHPGRWDAMHRGLYCTTIKILKALQEERASCSSCKRFEDWFSFEKSKYDPQSWYILKIHEKLKNLIFERAMLSLKKLIYSIMSQSYYSAMNIRNRKDSQAWSKSTEKALRSLPLQSNSPQCLCTCFQK